MSRPIPNKCNPELFKNIPQELKDIPRWLVCLKDKSPVNIDTGLVSGSNNKSTWHKFDDVVNVFNSNPDYYSIGFFFSKEDNIYALDVDECFKDNVLNRRAFNIIKIFSPCYIERSPSKAGLRIIFKAEHMAEIGNKVDYKKPVDGIGGIEITKDNFYCTITGDASKNSVSTLEDKSSCLKDFYTYLEKITNKKRTEPVSCMSSDHILPFEFKNMSAKSILAVIKQSGDEKMSALLEGDSSGYGSNSEAWFGLMSKLCFWTNGNAEMIYDIFVLTGMYSNNDRIQTEHRPGFAEKEIDKAITQWEINGAEHYGTISETSKTYAVDVNTGERTEEEGKVIKAKPFKVRTLLDVEKSLPSDYTTLNNFIVNKFIPKGITIITSDPKVGKSCLASQLAISLINGDKLMDEFDIVLRGNVLIFSNEENAASVLTRITRQGANSDTKNKVYTHDGTNDLIPLDEDGLQKINDIYLIPYNIKFVLVDIWDNQRPNVMGKNKNAYSIENLQAQPVKQFVNKRLNTPEEIHFIIFHHLNKDMKTKNNFQRMSGTNATRGTFDTNMVITEQDKKDGLYAVEIETRALNCEKIQDDIVIIGKTEELKFVYKGKYNAIIGGLTARHIVDVFIKTGSKEMTNQEISGGLVEHFGKRLEDNALAYHLRKLVVDGILHKPKKGTYEYTGNFPYIEANNPKPKIDEDLFKIVQENS